MAIKKRLFVFSASLFVLLIAITSWNSSQSENVGNTRAVDGLRELKEKLVVANRILDSEGLASPLGHISVRVPNTDRILISRTRAPGLVTLDDIVVINLDGEVLEGEGDLYNEIYMHTEIYRSRSEINSVAHTHSTMAIVVSLSGEGIKPISNEAVDFFSGVKTYEKIGLITTREKGEEVAKLLGQDNALLLKGHGAVIVGTSLEQAAIRAISLERAAYIQILAKGDIKPYSREEMETYSSAVKRALEKEAASLRSWEYFKEKALKKTKSQ